MSREIRDKIRTAVITGRAVLTTAAFACVQCGKRTNVRVHAQHQINAHAHCGACGQAREGNRP